jgi:hypothetical protein
MDNFSYLAVLIGGVAFFLLGAVWYSLLFRKPWMAGMGVDPSTPPQAPPFVPLAGTFIANLVVAWVIEFIVRDAGVGYGACRGTVVGLAAAAVIGQNALYDAERPKSLAVINGAYALVGSAIVGAIAGAL